MWSILCRSYKGKYPMKIHSIYWLCYLVNTKYGHKETRDCTTVDEKFCLM